jgi:hypothetical protein
VTKVNITGVVKLYASNCPPSPFTSREERPSPRAVAAIKPDGTFEFRNVPPGKYAVCVAIGEAPYVAGPSVKITDKDIDNLMLPKMRGPGPGATGTPLPSMAGSGTPTLDLARTEKAAQLDRDNAKKTEVAKKR